MNPFFQLKLQNNICCGWHNSGDIWFTGYFFDCDGRLFQETGAAEKIERSIDKEEPEKLVELLNGIFTIIIAQPGKIKIVTDRIGYFPLLYQWVNEKWIITDHSDTALKTKLNEETIPEFLAGGFVMGSETLISNLSRTQAGEVITLWENGHSANQLWYRFLPKTFSHKPFAQLQDELNKQLDKVTGRLITFLNGRTAMLPLSGGFDSRLIAAMLKKGGYENVICFTYGKESRESLLSKKVADILGFRWIFIDYSKLNYQGFSNDATFLAYADYMAMAASMPYLQEYFAAKALKYEYNIPEAAVFLPGHTGDYIAGSYVSKSIANPKKEIELNTRIEERYFWFLDKTPQQKKKIEERLKQLLADHPAPLPETPGYNPIIEDWEIREKISRFIFRSSHVFNWFGFQVYLPLWDGELVDFFREVPYVHRLNKKLYDETLIRDLFIPLNIYFPDAEFKYSNRPALLRKALHFLKTITPRHIKHKKLRQADWINYFSFTAELKKGLPANERRSLRKLNSYNAIICAWYVNRIRKKTSHY